MTESIPDSTDLLCHGPIPRMYPGVRQRYSYHRHQCSHQIPSPAGWMLLPAGPDCSFGNLNFDPDFQIRDLSCFASSSSNRSFDCPAFYSPYLVPLVNKFGLPVIGSGTIYSYKHRAVESNSCIASTL